MPRVGLLKATRIVHLYFGVFIAPALIFFAFTGALQTFGLHESNRDHPNYKPARWVAVLAQIHKKQTSVLPQRRPPEQPTARPAAHTENHPDAHADARPAQQTAPPQATPAPPQQPARSPLPLRIFFLIVSIGLFTSTITGLYMSYAYTRNKRLVTLTLLAGIVIPPLLLLV